MSADVTYPYLYVRYMNRYPLPWQYVADNLVSQFIAQDTEKEYAFVVTYQCTNMTSDAIIDVYQPGRTKLISFGTVIASSNPVLADLRPIGCDLEEELTESQLLKYFEDGYIAPGYI